jgi:hypothetical protein
VPSSSAIAAIDLRKKFVAKKKVLDIFSFTATTTLTRGDEPPGTERKRQ